MGFEIGDRVKYYHPPDVFGSVVSFDGKYFSVQWEYRTKPTYRHLERELVLADSKDNAPVHNPARGWQDESDKSTYKNIRPDIHAACAYANDGSCWEWAVGLTNGDILSFGRSIDRRTAKSDAEFFIANYQPEDTTDRDELRRKLERSWHGS